MFCFLPSPCVLNITFTRGLTHLSAFGEHAKIFVGAAEREIATVNIYDLVLVSLQVFQHISEVRERSNTEYSGGYQPQQTENHSEKAFDQHRDRKLYTKLVCDLQGRRTQIARVGHGEGKKNSQQDSQTKIKATAVSYFVHIE